MIIGMDEESFPPSATAPSLRGACPLVRIGQPEGVPKAGGTPVGGMPLPCSRRPWTRRPYLALRAQAEQLPEQLPLHGVDPLAVSGGLPGEPRTALGP